MDEHALRAMVREAIARQLGPSTEAGDRPMPVSFASDLSHFRYTLPKTDGPCLIEPGVQCNHCGYCESHGH